MKITSGSIWISGTPFETANCQLPTPPRAAWLLFAAGGAGVGGADGERPGLYLASGDQGGPERAQGREALGLYRHVYRQHPPARAGSRHGISDVGWRDKGREEALLPRGAPERALSIRG